MALAGAVAHIDIDCFFAQVATIEDPQLEGKAVAVYQHEDILSVSYEARALGIKRHDTTAEVKKKYGKEIRLISVPMEPGTTKVSYAKYISLSFEMERCIQQLVSGSIEKAGLDEFYIDLSNEPQNESKNGSEIEEDNKIIIFGPPITIPSAIDQKLIQTRILCQKIMASIKEKVGVTVSIGISGSKMISKMASSRFKPEKLSIILPRHYSLFMQDVSPLSLPGFKSHCGEAADFLSKYSSVADVLAAEDQIIMSLSEKESSWLMNACKGTNNELVVPKKIPQTISSSMTLRPIARGNINAIRKVLEYGIQSLMTRLQHDNNAYHRFPTRISLKYRLVGEKESSFPSVVCTRNPKWETLLDQFQKHFISIPRSSWELIWFGFFVSKFKPNSAQRQASATSFNPNLH